MQKSRLDRQYMQLISMKDVTNILCAGCVTHTTAGKECIANMITNLENAQRNQSVYSHQCDKKFRPLQWYRYITGECTEKVQLC